MYHTLYHSEGQKSEMCFNVLKSRCQESCTTYRACGGKSISFFFQWTCTFHGLQLPSIFKANNDWSVLSPVLYFDTSKNYVGPTQITQDNILILRSDNQKPLFHLQSQLPCYEQVTKHTHMFYGKDTDLFGRTNILPTTDLMRA